MANMENNSETGATVIEDVSNNSSSAQLLKMVPAGDDAEFENNENYDEDEVVLNEVNDVSILHSSRLSMRLSHSSLKNEIPIKEVEEDVVISHNYDKLRRFIKNLPLKGYILALLCALCSATMTVLIKLSYTFAGSDATLIRYIIQFSTMFCVARHKKINPLGPRKQRKLLTLRAFVGVSNLVALFFAFKLIDPSDCLAITHTSVIITSVLARIVLKEKLTVAHVITLILTVSGVILITRHKSLNDSYEKMTHHTDDDEFNSSQSFTSSNLTYQNATTIKIQESNDSLFITLVGVGLALFSAVANSVVQVILKKLCMRKVHFSVTTIYTTYVGMPTSAIVSTLLILTGMTHKNLKSELKILPIHFVYILLAGFVGVLGQVFLNISLNYEDTSKIIIVKTVDVFFSFILQYFILNIKIDIFSVIGSLLIISGTFLVLSFKLIEESLKTENTIDETFEEKVKMKPNKNMFVKFVQFKF